MELFMVSAAGRIMKILLSVSLLSLLLSSLIPLLFQSLNQFSINKSYVFIFCNGLMIFIAKNSSLPSDSSSQFNDLDVAAPVNSQELDMVAADSVEQIEEEEEEKRMIVADSHQEEEEVADTEKEEEEEEEKRMIVADSQQEEDEVDNTENEEEEEGSNNGVWMTEEEEEDEVEELNKKCEDFIRKMKAAFCSEPRQSYYGCSDVDHHHTAMVTVM